MNNVVDEVLAGSPKYTLTYNDNTTATGVSIDLETQVTTQGTPLNKALFDSIQSDLNTRLLISSKATTSQAQGGSNDTNYMTPSKVKTQLQYLTKTTTFQSTTASTAQTHTVFDASNVPSGVSRVIISGYMQINHHQYNSSLVASYTNRTGTGTGDILSTTYSNSPSGSYSYSNNFPFEYDIDLKNGIIRGSVYHMNSTATLESGTYYCVGLSTIVATLRGTGTGVANPRYNVVSYTTTYIY